MRDEAFSDIPIGLGHFLQRLCGTIQLISSASFSTPSDGHCFEILEDRKSMLRYDEVFVECIQYYTVNQLRNRDF
jgi:hypothetical protein